MADLPAKREASGKTFKEQYVPLEQRESRHFDSLPFFKDLTVGVAMTVIGTVAGFFIGKKLEPRNIKLSEFAQFKMGTDRVDRKVGLITGFGIGSLWGVLVTGKKPKGNRVA